VRSSIRESQRDKLNNPKPLRADARAIEAAHQGRGQRVVARRRAVPQHARPSPLGGGLRRNACMANWLGMPPDISGICAAFGCFLQRCGMPSSDPALCGVTTLPDGGGGAAGGDGAGGSGGTSGPSRGGQGGGGSGGAIVMNGEKDSCSCSLPTTAEGTPTARGASF
jgi:hypothetical protein